MQADTEVATTSPSSFHPLFSDPGADIVLGSKNGTLFRVHSFTLKSTSGWFRTMFTLPQSAAAERDVVIYVDEDAATLEGLLRMVCGLPIPRLDSYDVIEPILHAAEKYDMSGPASIVRALVTTPPLLAEPLRLYAIACRYGWLEEAKMASQYTLTLNLHDPSQLEALRKLGTDALLDLFQFHRNRRETLRRRLNDPPFVSDSRDMTCSNCSSNVDYHTWRELKYVIILELDKRPLGDTVCSEEFSECPAARACWDARCSRCEKVLYDQKETVRGIRECIEQLPKSVEISFHNDDTATVTPSTSTTLASPLH